MSFSIDLLPEYIAAVSAIGAAATGLVDSTKLFNGGISRFGYGIIQKHLSPYDTVLSAIPEDAAFETIYGLWINGADKDDQKAKVKALIKMGLSPATAPSLAQAAGLPEPELTDLAKSFAAGTALSAVQVNIYGRLDAVLSAVLDAAYEQADQRYRNAAKVLAAIFAVLLSLFGDHAVNGASANPLVAVFIGLIATPLAPVAKDITTAINDAVQASGKIRALLK
jgi:phage tail protein X